MSLSAFDDRAHRPDAAELRRVLGRAQALWSDVVDQAGSECAGLVEVWHFAGPKFGWSLRLKQKDRVMLYLTPCPGHFLAGLVIGTKAAAGVKDGLSQAAVAVLNAAPRYAEGIGVRMRVSSAADVRVVLQLLGIKAAASAAARRRTSP
jgi:hypothetical protein